MLRHAQAQALAVPGQADSSSRLTMVETGMRWLGTSRMEGAEAGLRQQVKECEAQLAGDVRDSGEVAALARRVMMQFPWRQLICWFACC